MRISKAKIFLVGMALFCAIPAFCCTSVIISSKASGTGAPVMLKHRDTDSLDNRLAWFQGEKYNFVGLVNSSLETKEVWTGINSAGFSIMNTATYDLEPEPLPAYQKDKEGYVMYRALEVCETLKDFENYLDTIPRPTGCEANFGVIDAHGGAAYYEVNSTKWVKFDVNQTGSGYMVVTNFSRTGDPSKRKGVDRYEVASDIMEEIIDAKKASYIDHYDLISGISRSGAPILRKITSASIVIEGVKYGEDPKNTIMWTALGYPSAVPAFPVIVGEKDCIPKFMKKSTSSSHAEICDKGLQMKKSTHGIGEPDKLDDLQIIIDRRFGSIFDRYKKNLIGDMAFLSAYKNAANYFYDYYCTEFFE